MRTIGQYFADYGAVHRTSGNKITHYFGIPAIVVAILGLLDRVVLLPGTFLIFHFSLATVLFVGASLFYLRLDLLLGGAMVCVAAALYALGVLLSAPVLVGLFLGGWIVQFAGHEIYEKKKPAFLKNLIHLIIGPIFILNSALKLRK